MSKSIPDDFRNPLRTCSIEDCNRPHVAKGLCGAHYARQRRGGDVQRPVAVPWEETKCETPGCTAPARAYQLCKKHHQRLTKWGTTSPRTPPQPDLLPGEKWRVIPAPLNQYEASDLGRIRKVHHASPNSIHLRGSTLTTFKNKLGYVQVTLSAAGRKTQLVHRLVAAAFIPNPEGKPQVNHKNGVKSDNRIGNLEWVTGSENQRHRYEVLGHKRRRSNKP